MGGVLGRAESFWTRFAPAVSAAWDADLQTSAVALRASFAVPVICFAVVFAYAVFALAAGLRSRGQKNQG
jgi:hypothetical protein